MKYCTHWLRISSEFFLKNILRLMFSQRGFLERKFPLMVICYPISFLIKNAHLTIGILQRLKFLLSRRFKYILLSNLHCGETEKHRQFNELTSMWNLKQTKTKKYPPPHQKKKKKAAYKYREQIGDWQRQGVGVESKWMMSVKRYKFPVIK